MAWFIKSSMSFIAGTGLGVYIAQNYNVPNVKKLASMAVSVASHLEQAYRKPKPESNNKDDDVQDS
ncbi:hypothetical protein MtrunA17_Chr5g0399131 [Medicago truncatula]|uniref:Transmembrane protein n=1 Tax=Medicago truncatula TaxID=3880 RepID=G7JW18_MEDTR|nr:uncharacterized protein LOC11430243 [Medicago truncatula]AES94251.1 hypothetical protein MTR_5g012410 [Medicago truncatula]RHN53740.1 hypothetical protein MtrunA17_Chr5g0399131 [Medicago truncatula]